MVELNRQQLKLKLEQQHRKLELEKQLQQQLEAPAADNSISWMDSFPVCLHSWDTHTSCCLSPLFLPQHQTSSHWSDAAQKKQ